MPHEGDLGRSYLYHAPVAGLISERMPITLTLGLTGLCIALVVAIPLGILAAMREGTLLDRAISTVALFGQAMPSFWLGLVLIIWLGLSCSCCRSPAWTSGRATSCPASCWRSPPSRR